MHSPSLLDYYKSIESTSERMLASAQAGCWDDVARSETTCSILIGQLKLQAESETLEPQSRREKSRIMQRILRNDACIRRLAEPWLEKIDVMLNGSTHLVH